MTTLQERTNATGLRVPSTRTTYSVPSIRTTNITVTPEYAVQVLT
jgi:hypothetical protein